jgi:predicted nucleic acid-binding protein
MLIVSSILENTYKPVSKDGTYSIKHSISGDSVILKFMTVMHYTEDSSMKIQLDRARSQAQQLIKETCENLRREYKEKTGETLKLKLQENGRDDVELISSTSQSVRKVAYYRYNVEAKID